jgi:hypothetical protein
MHRREILMIIGARQRALKYVNVEAFVTTHLV